MANAPAGRCICSVILLAAAMTVIAPAQTYTILANFDGTNGGDPGRAMQLVQGLDGNLWGTTSIGGISNSGHYGTIFKMTTAGVLSTEFEFPSAYGPTAGLALAPNGLFYGTTPYGGPDGVGAFFSFAPTTRNLILLSSGFGGSYGSPPLTGVVRAFNGTFYGTTAGGGANNYGTIFETTASGYIYVVYNLDSTSGAASESTLVQGGNGSFFGTTNHSVVNPNGTVFEVTPTVPGTLNILHSFDGTDGTGPGAGLVQGPGGYFYGTTSGGGTYGTGTVFKISTTGTFTSLYSFGEQVNGIYPNGLTPTGVLAAGTDGNLYGLTEEGGQNNYGTIYRITPSGTVTPLYSFTSSEANQTGGLIQATDGNFYGALGAGGTNGYGGIYQLSVGLAPFVKALPAIGKVGATIEILGTDLIGASAVTFNGTPAAFTIKSASLITATVPSGATSGRIDVTTPRGTLKSNVAFNVK